MSAVAGTKVIDKDKDAVWVCNLTEFRFAHGTREGVVFESKYATRVKMDAWIEGQMPLLHVITDPHTDDMPDSPVIVETPLVNAENGEPVTGVGTGPEGTRNGDAVRKELAKGKGAAATKAPADTK